MYHNTPGGHREASGKAGGKQTVLALNHFHGIFLFIKSNDGPLVLGQHGKKGMSSASPSALSKESTRTNARTHATVSEENTNNCRTGKTDTYH